MSKCRTRSTLKILFEANEFFLASKWGTIKAMENDVREVAVNVVKEAGEILAQFFGKAEVLRTKTASAADTVTQLDIDTENMIKGRLQAFDSSIGFVGEESEKIERTQDDKQRYWLLDPIDGTSHFVRGIPFCTTMLALVEEKQVVFSIIYNFVTKELFIAEKGKGATLNGQVLAVSNRSLAQAYLFVEADVRKEVNMTKYSALRKRATLMNTISCGYEYGLVSLGKIDGRICFDPYGADWDYAAGSLLVSEAGGVVANIGKETYDFTNHDFIAANAKVYEELTSGDAALFPVT